MGFSAKCNALGHLDKDLSKLSKNTSGRFGHRVGFALGRGMLVFLPDSGPPARTADGLA
jgi:hypothetical protein